MKLRTKTSLLLAMIVMAVIGALGAYYVHLVESSVRRAVFNGLEGVSRTAVTHVETWLVDCLRDANAIAANLPRKALQERDAAALSAYLQTMAVINSQFDNGLFILDEQGTLLSDYPHQEKLRGVNFAHRQYFQESMKQGRGVVGVPYVSARTGEPVITSTALILGPDGHVVGLVGCSSRLLSPLALGGLREQKIGKTGYVYMYDRTRLMILHPQNDRVLKRDIPPGANRLLDAAIDGYEGVGHTVNSRGIPMLISLTRVPATDWIVAAQQTVDEAYAPLEELKVHILLSALLGAAAALTLGVFAIRRITLPLGELHRSALWLKQRYAGSFELGDSIQTDPAHDSRANHQDKEISLLSRTLTDLSEGLDATMGALRDSEARYRTLFEMAQEPILVLNHEGDLVDCNPAAERLFSATRKDLLARSFMQLTPAFQPDGAHSLEKARSVFEKALRGEPQRFEWVQETVEGEPFDAEVVLGAAFVGKELGMLAVVRDISRQKQAHAHLQQEWERFAAVLDGSPIATFMIDLERRVVLWNRACEVMTSMAREQVLGKPLDLTPLFHGRDLPVLSALLLEFSDEEILADYGGRQNLRFNPELGTLETSTYILTEGRRRILRASAARILDAQGNIIGIVQSAQDVTREDELQQQLLQASKLESIGTMAGGMAHEFNNILAVIQGHAQLLHMDIEDGPSRTRNRGELAESCNDELLDHVNQIVGGCQRAATLTRNMLTFARSEEGKMIPTKLNPVLENVARLLRQTLPPSVVLEIDLMPDLPFVLADACQLEQAVVNLIVNARDAMPNGGRISLRTRLNRSAGAVAAAIAGGNGHKHADGYVAVEVADTGEGIPLDHLERIFDPFFTTKEPGKGTGLGLSIVYSIVKTHGGSVQVESEQPGGTCFRLTFPGLAGGVVTRAEIPPSEADGSFDGKGETLLIVDDEEQVRQVLASMLRAAGYRVVAAANGQEALSLYKDAMENSGPFDLVVLDLSMPVLGGRECLAGLMALDPSAKVLLSSGLVETEMQGEILQKAAGILKKPFQFRELTEEVSRVLQ
jgi:PAS domain S-box-containing protein